MEKYGTNIESVILHKMYAPACDMNALVRSPAYC
jgi:hypothetical protein